jgi:hypothetical protein
MGKYCRLYRGLPGIQKIVGELVQNPVGFGQALGKTGQKPGFSVKSKEAVPKIEVLEQFKLLFIFCFLRSLFYGGRL